MITHGYQAACAKKPAQLDVQVSGTVSIEAVRTIMERAFLPPREVEAPEVIPIEQVSHVLIDIEPPPLPERADEVVQSSVKFDSKFDLNAARSALKEEE